VKEACDSNCKKEQGARGIHSIDPQYFGVGTLNSSGVQEKAMQQFQGKELVNVRGVVAISFEVPQDSSFDAFAVEVGTRKRPRVEQHVPNIPGQCVSVPN